VLPWYLLHQPVVVAVAFYVVQWPVAPWAKYGIICAASVPITWALYDLGVRRTRLTRTLFGAG
jgi:peptidoglycan/LPS O-acetylase OafA/YrhL